VTIPDAVLIQFDLLRISIIVLKTCRGMYLKKEFEHQVGNKNYYYIMMHGQQKITTRVMLFT